MNYKMMPKINALRIPSLTCKSPSDVKPTVVDPHK